MPTDAFTAGADLGFPIGGAATLGREHQHTNLPDIPKNCIKFKKFWSGAGGGSKGISATTLDQQSDNRHHAAHILQKAGANCISTCCRLH